MVVNRCKVCYSIVTVILKGAHGWQDEAFDTGMKTALLFLILMSSMLMPLVLLLFLFSRINPTTTAPHQNHDGFSRNPTFRLRQLPKE